MANRRKVNGGRAPRGPRHPDLLDSLDSEPFSGRRRQRAAVSASKISLTFRSITCSRAARLCSSSRFNL